MKIMPNSHRHTRHDKTVMSVLRLVWQWQFELDNCCWRVLTSNFPWATVLSCRRESSSHRQRKRYTEKTVLSCLAWRCELAFSRPTVCWRCAVPVRPAAPGSVVGTLRQSDGRTRRSTVGGGAGRGRETTPRSTGRPPGRRRTASAPRTTRRRGAAAAAGRRGDGGLGARPRPAPRRSSSRPGPGAGRSRRPAHLPDRLSRSRRSWCTARRVERRRTACKRSRCPAETFTVTGKESVPKIITNDKIMNLVFKTAISISVISNRNSFRVPFDKIASVYILFEKNILIL